MSDPLERLGASTQTTAPDLAGIKSRAGRIQRRRRVLVSSSAAVIAAIALAGVIVRPGMNNDGRQLAQSTSASATPPSKFETAAGAATSSGDATAGGSAAKRAEVQRRGSPAPEPAQERSAMAATTAADSSAKSDALEVTVTASDIAGPRSVRFVLQACNRNAQPVKRTFNTGQRYDFDVSRGGNLVWRWSDGMAFTQMVGEETWEPKTCKTFSATWNGTDRNGAPAPTGSYQVVGSLTSSPKQSSAPKSFCLDLC